MAIGKKPQRYTKDIQTQYEQKAISFITKVEQSAVVQEKNHKQPIMIRFDQKLLARIDLAAQRRGISRSSWVHYIVSQALDHDEE